MAVRLQFEGIRCFNKRQDVAIRPITLLVGENSSGKTTFLALCRIAHAIIQEPPRALPFNEVPFWLGAYDQIASKRAGSGRAAAFSLAVSTVDGGSRAEFRAEFVSREGQPSLRRWSLTGGPCMIEVTDRGIPFECSIVLESPGGRAEGKLGGVDAESLAGEPVRIVAGLFPEEMARGGLSSSDIAPLEAAQKSLRGEFPRRPYAFAPVRTSPRRTYDPISAESEPEGSHVPMVMAALARSASKRSWLSLRSALGKFGSGSGLFEAIEIVNKGKSKSDPFQIGIRSGGSVFNLIDVGYGVSQAVPILVDTIRRSLPWELFLLQQPEVHLHPRAQAELGSFFAGQAAKKRRFVIETHSDHLVDRIRMEVRRQQLKPEDVSLLYFERNKHGATIHSLELDRNGTIMDPPPGYRQFFLNEERDLLGI
jgi:hypothetical protein